MGENHEKRLGFGLHQYCGHKPRHIRKEMPAFFNIRIPLPAHHKAQIRRRTQEGCAFVQVHLPAPFPSRGELRCILTELFSCLG